MLVAGGDESDGAAAGSLVFESDTGSIDVPTPSFPQARAFATVTPFGSGLLLAGGENPLNTDVVGEREARQKAAVYDPRTRDSTRDPIALELARTRHAAVVLESGETLLVGGGRPSGDGTTVTVTPFELVSPETRRSRIDGLVGLADGRLEPTALRLDNGNVLVGGGYTPTGEPRRNRRVVFARRVEPGLSRRRTLWISRPSRAPCSLRATIARSLRSRAAGRSPSAAALRASKTTLAKSRVASASAARRRRRTPTGSRPTAK